MSLDNSVSSIPRRGFLANSFNGFGAVALGDLFARSAIGDASTADLFSVRKPHLARRAKHCIFLFMQGGVSQLDSFEYKPELTKHHGQPLPRILDISGELQGRLSFPHATVGSPFAFQQHGESGHWFSELYPHLATHADRLAFVRGIRTDNQNHGPSTLHVTTGSQFPGSPSVGSWVSYGLGTSNRNMPGYVVIQDPRGAPGMGRRSGQMAICPPLIRGLCCDPRGRRFSIWIAPRALLPGSNAANSTRSIG